MKILREITILFLVCLAGTLVSAVVPFGLPASIATMVLLFLLLSTKVIKVKQIEKTSNYLLENMMVFFVPVSVGIIEVLPLLRGQLLPVVLVCVLATLATFVVAYASTRLAVRLIDKKERV